MATRAYKPTSRTHPTDRRLWRAGGPGFSSDKDDWATPQAVFETLDEEFLFDVDVCASSMNAKCRRFFTAADDGLAQEWAGVAWCNPPYGGHGGGIRAWMKKARDSARAGATVVCLVPARTDTRWWHESAMAAAEVRLVKGRLSFGDGRGTAPFPSAIVIFRPGHEGLPTFSAVEAKTLLAAGAPSSG